MFGKGIYLYLFYFLCYIRDISTDMSEYQVEEERDLELNEGGGVSDWMQLGKSIGGMLTSKVIIRRIFMT